MLAWGNSVGDFFANIAVARKSRSSGGSSNNSSSSNSGVEMAIAGCYGGPVFNLLLGLGLSFTYVCSTSFPEPFFLQLDASCKISLVSLAAVR